MPSAALRVVAHGFESDLVYKICNEYGVTPQFMATTATRILLLRFLKKERKGRGHENLVKRK